MAEGNWRKSEKENFYLDLYCSGCGMAKSLNRHIKGCGTREAVNIEVDKVCKILAGEITEFEASTSTGNLSELYLLAQRAYGNNSWGDKKLAEVLTPFGVLVITTHPRFGDQYDI